MDEHEKERLSSYGIHEKDIDGLISLKKVIKEKFNKFFQYEPTTPYYPISEEIGKILSCNISHDPIGLTEFEFRYNPRIYAIYIRNFHFLNEEIVLGPISEFSELKWLFFNCRLGYQVIEEEIAMRNYNISVNPRLGNLKSLSIISGLTKLERLSANGHHIKNLKGIEKMVNLSELYLSFNDIEEITGIENLTQLTKLFLNNNKIKSLKGIEKLDNLKVLTISYNQFEESTVLMRLRKNKYDIFEWHNDFPYDHRDILEMMSFKQLNEFCVEYNIKILSNYNKSQIIQKIREFFKIN